MGINVELRGEDGPVLESLEDGENLVKGFLPDFNDVTFFCLRFIDPYGDTVFNRLQMETFLKEWERVRPKATGDRRKELWERVQKIAWRCNEEVHLYLKFIGD